MNRVSRSFAFITCSVADPGCLSRIQDPDFYPSRIPDPTTAMKDRGETKFVVKPFFCHKFHEIELFHLWNVESKNLAQFSKNYRTFHFTQKIVTKLSKIWVWDPGSGKNLFRIQESKRHRIPDPDPQHWSRGYQDAKHIKFCAGTVNLHLSLKIFKIRKMQKSSFSKTVVAYYWPLVLTFTWIRCRWQNSDPGRCKY